MGYRDIECEQVGDILVLRQNRPYKLNARTTQMYMEIMAALAEADANPSVTAVVLTGNGKFFSAGMDFQNEPQLAYESLDSDPDSVRAVKSSLPKRDPDDVSTWPPVRFIEAFIEFQKPLIGAVNGPAIGEGFSSLLHCDVVFAADTAYFWAPFARAGVAPEFCATYLMPKRLGENLAHAAIYLSRRISAEEAQASGFVLEVLPAGGEFESQVIARLGEGLDLAGPPALRIRTLGQYKGLLRTDEEKLKLRAICHAEFELIKERAQSGDTAAVQQAFAAQLPS